VEAGQAGQGIVHLPARVSVPWVKSLRDVADEVWVKLCCYLPEMGNVMTYGTCKRTKVEFTDGEGSVT
jgi:hypothetical protein